MTEETAAFLTSNDGRQQLAAAANLPGDAPTRLLALRKRGLLLAHASGIVALLDARHRARFRFPDADRLFFTAESLSQATSPTIAAFHASRLALFGTVVDLGCGVGIDAIAFAEAGMYVLAVERDPARLRFARANAEVCGVSERITFVLGDVTTLDWQADAAYWDPARRESGPDGHRVSRHADRYEPPLSFLETIRERVKGGLVKLSPALPDDVLQSLNATVRFLSEGRECKEACVLWGDVSVPEPSLNSAALLLPDEQIFPTGDDECPVAAAIGTWIFDPDPAIVRAGALPALCESLGAALLTPDDSYLTGDRDPEPFLRRAALPYRVRETMPYKPRLVGEWLRAQNIGRLVIKKRHFAKEPDAVARELKLSGKGREITLLLAREGGGFRAVFCEPLA